jgi:hypothetical protein
VQADEDELGVQGRDLPRHGGEVLRMANYSDSTLGQYTRTIYSDNILRQFTQIASSDNMLRLADGERATAFQLLPGSDLLSFIFFVDTD